MGTVILKSGEKVVHDSDMYEVNRDGSLVLYKIRDGVEPPKKSSWWEIFANAPSFPMPPYPPRTVRIYAAGEWKEFY